MLLRIRCEDSNGWPIINVLDPIVEGGDRLRFQNYGNMINNNFKAFAKAQREATKAAKQGHQHRTSTRFSDLLIEAVLGRSLDSLVEEEVIRRNSELTAEVERLRSELENCNGRNGT